MFKEYQVVEIQLLLKQRLKIKNRPPLVIYLQLPICLVVIQMFIFIQSTDSLDLIIAQAEVKDVNISFDVIDIG